MRLFCFTALLVLAFNQASAFGGEGDSQPFHEALTIFHKTEQEKLAGEIRAILEENCGRIILYLGMNDCPGVSIWIADSPDEFQRLTRGQLPEWAGAACDPSLAAIYLQGWRGWDMDRLEEEVLHEYSHVALARAVLNRPLPRWLDEGFAQLQAREISLDGAVAIARSILSGNLIRLADIEELLAFPRQKATLAYRLSYEAVFYLHQLAGPAGFASMVRRIRQGHDLEHAIRLSTGLEWNRFESSWNERLRRTYRWYILLDYPFVFGASILVLLASGFLLTRIRNRRRMQAWNEADTLVLPKT
ncbi:hypothetical protein JW906_13330 [bacterium]|nr:hypothetical protein [bacterium]